MWEVCNAKQMLSSAELEMSDVEATSIPESPPPPDCEWFSVVDADSAINVARDKKTTTGTYNRFRFLGFIHCAELGNRSHVCDRGQRLVKQKQDIYV